MKKTSNPPAEDGQALWQKVTSSVTPLRHRQTAGKSTKDTLGGTARLQPPPPPTSYIPAAPVHPARLKPLASEGRNSKADIDTGTLRRLRSGEISISGRLDLHGMTRDRAHAALLRFIHHGYHNGRRCVLVITGRSGVLRTEVPRWLNEEALRPYLIALAPARPDHGGVGALYVLLKRRRD